MVAKKKPASARVIFIPRAAFALAFCLGAVGVTILSFAGGLPSGRRVGANANSQRDAPSIDTATRGQLHRGVYRRMPVTYVLKNGKAIFRGHHLGKAGPD